MKTPLVGRSGTKAAEKADSLTSVFQVNKQLILCGKILADLARPSSDAMQLIKADLSKFELTYRNYRSAETISCFGSDEKAVRQYLRALKHGGAILCYRIVADFARYQARGYVALRIENRSVEMLAHEFRADPLLLEPVDDVLHVQPQNVADISESDITHILINSYDFPGRG